MMEEGHLAIGHCSLGQSL
jgi:hypothetical protein